MTNPVITQQDLNVMKGMFHKDPVTGEYLRDDRSGMYLKYFELTGSLLAVDTAQASTFSETFIGQTDEMLNKIVQYFYPDQYPTTPADFSREVAETLIAAMQDKYDATNNEIELRMVA